MTNRIPAVTNAGLEREAATYAGKPCGRCGGTQRRRGNRSCAACDRARKRIENMTEEQAERERERNRERYHASSWFERNARQLKARRRAGLKRMAERPPVSGLSISQIVQEELQRERNRRAGRGVA